MIDKGGGVFLGIGLDFQVLGVVYKPLERSIVTRTPVGLDRHPDYTRIVIQVQIEKAIEGILARLRSQGTTIGVIFVFSSDKSIYLIGGVAYEKGFVIISEMDAYKEESQAITISFLGKGTFFGYYLI